MTSKATRRRHASAFKAKVALAAVRGDEMPRPASGAGYASTMPSGRIRHSATGRQKRCSRRRDGLWI